MTRKNMPARVYLKHSAYYYVTPQNKWVRLSAEKDGMPAMYRALAALTDREATSDMMPAVVSRWLESKRTEWSEKMRKDQDRIADRISEAFADCRPSDVTTPLVSEYLDRYSHQPRTYNMHRTMLKMVLAWAAEKGHREGYNPVTNIDRKATKPRKRWLRDDEIAAMRASAMQQTRNGEALVQMIDLALLTGQRIGDLLKLRWQDVDTEGVHVTQQKTGERLLIGWTPELREAMRRCERGDPIGFVLKNQSGHGYTYSGIRSAWVRACERAGIEDLHIHDMRGRAGMDKRDADGLEGAKELLGHKSIKQTEDYVDGKAPRRVKPAR